MPDRNLSVGAFGDEVRDLQRKLLRHGVDLPPAEVERGFFGPVTREVVRQWQREHGLKVTGVVDETTATAIEAASAELGRRNEGESLWPVPRPLAPPDHSAPNSAGVMLVNPVRGPSDGSNDKIPMIVRGRIVSHELRGLAGLRLVAVDKNVGGDVTLGEGMTVERGAYDVRYNTAALRQGKRNPDIQVQVIGQDQEILARSSVRYNAGPEENGLDIVIPAEKLPRPAEYRRLVTELGDHIEAQNESQLKSRLSALKEDEQQQDITYLANKTGWDARMVAMTSLASQFGERSGIEPEFYYALFRAGMPANDATLSQLAPQTVQQVWQSAIEQQILPVELEEDIPKALERFKAYSIDRVLNEPARIGVSSFRELLEGTLGDAISQQRFAQLHYEHRADPQSFWESIREEFPEQTSRLQLDSNLGFLTINNARLIQRLHAQNSDLHTPIDLVRRGLYESKAWELLLGDDVPIPTEVPGEEPEEKKANYAALMSSQVRLSYPTAVVAEMVRADAIALGADQPVKTAVAQFLTDHQGRFELGLHPVDQYLRKNDIALENPVLAQVKALQRVYQISPSDEVMGKLLQRNLDSAYAVVRYDEQTFVGAFKDELGGEAMARLTYAKAHQVHHTVLNIATAYLLERSSPSLYAIDNLPARKGGWVEALPQHLIVENFSVPANPTLEEIFGEMNYCGCEHCRSWLSPAAYLVDLLQFLDFSPHERGNPLDVLLGRRPDIQHLQLTCENTNTMLPYIDLVNEILEHFVVNGSLTTFTGHNVVEGVATEELLASPQFVKPAAYTELRNQAFPPPLPFHQPLEALRRYFEHFDAPLHEVMESLRKNDDPERDGGSADPAYGWRDLLMERLRLSRPEYAILTDSGIPLQTLYGEDPATVTIPTLIGRLSKVKEFARRLSLTYEEVIEIIRTQFVNPHSHLIPKLEKLEVNFATIKRFIDGTLNSEAFEALLPDKLDTTPYGGNVELWLRDNEAQIMNLIVLSDPTGSSDVCSIDTLELRYSLPDPNNKLNLVEFLKLLRFTRLWRKLGWTIEQTNRAVTALFPPDKYPSPDDDVDTAKNNLDAGFQTIILRLAHLQTVMEQLGLTPNRDLSALLTCWSPIDTHGYHSLYRQMFLNPAILSLDDVFKDDGYGRYLAEKREYQAGAEPPKLLTHAEALRAAFSLTQQELELILQELIFDNDTVLNLSNVSAIFRHSYLARKLRISVRELLALKALSGLDPFLPLDLVQQLDQEQPFGGVRPPAIRFIELAQRISASPIKVSQMLYFSQHVDLSGKASPSQQDVLKFARTLRYDLLRIDQETVVQEDPTGDVAKAKMALVYGTEATDVFFGLLNNTSPFSVTYSHGQASLEDDIRSVTNRISYDDFQKRLSFRGIMTAVEKAGLEGVANTADFGAAVQALFDDGQEALAAFFDRYPELKAQYQEFVDSDVPTADKMSALLTNFLPELRARLKRQQVLQTCSALLGADLNLVTLLLEDVSLLHAVDQPADSAIADFLALQTQGISAEIFFASDVVGVADQSGVLVKTIDYREGGATLPTNPTDFGAPISAVWSGFLEAPDNGFFNFYVEADSGAEISLTLDGEPVTLVPDDGVWQNQDAINLSAGLLSKLTLSAKKVTDVLVLKWEHKGIGRAPIPAAQLYPAVTLECFMASYLRLLKALAVGESVGLSSAELKYFASHHDYFIDGEGWVNALPVAPSPAGSIVQALLGNVLAMLQYRALKDILKVQDESLLELLQNPAAAGEDGAPLLSRVTGWSETDRNALMDHFGLTAGDLAHLRHFVRLHDALAVVKRLRISVATLLNITTNEPNADRLRNLQGALCARYDQSDWLKVIQPINDKLRSDQRDALVAYVLHLLEHDDDLMHINTPEKLFEYLLIDVEMDPCMKTSRIRQSLSTVQLFIQRCLLNLESKVASSSINAKQWEWMKRYRLWEANRKVFLFPENWLEPELRDNKSSFFKELESELLQSDITDDAAATALVHYLEKLDKVAKLEICGMYYVENEMGGADDIVHVIARTAGAGRSYYYRRQEGGVVWTPWEKVDLNIEDNPVLPVVWKGRLFLFWLSVLQEVPTEQAPSGNPSDEVPLAQLKAPELKSMAGDTKTRVPITLYWSEYYNDKWQPARTSDLNRFLGELRVSSFDRTKLMLRSSEVAGNLFVHVDYHRPFQSTAKTYFKLYNTHSQPVQKHDDSETPPLHLKPTRLRTFSGSKDPFKFSILYYNPAGTSENQLFSREVLNRAKRYGSIGPWHQTNDVFEAPFFVQDEQHVFFVDSWEKWVYLEGKIGGPGDVKLWTDPGWSPPEPDQMGLSVMVNPDFPLPPEEILLPANLMRSPVIDPRSLESYLRDDPYVHQVMDIEGTIQFEGRLIGPRGSAVTRAEDLT